MARTHALPDGPLVAWYGDDYTGAAAVMEVLTFAGLPSVLFLDMPTREQLQRFDQTRGIGIAGSARSRSPAWMDEQLPPVLAFLAGLNAPLFHYKICSTLDSAPSVGSIGRAAELCFEATGADWAALFPAAPAIGRYQAFGNLFAAAGECVHRLDRHPVMASHPITPMNEADVCRHLAKQTAIPLGLVPVDAMQSSADADKRLSRERSAGARIIAIDTVDDRTLSKAGRLMWHAKGKPAFAIGSQGVEYALVQHWRDEGLLPKGEPTHRAARVDRMVAAAGSVSSTTDAQITWAEANGFSGVRIDPRGALETGKARENWVQAAINAALAATGDPIVYSARGPDDQAIAVFRSACDAAGLAGEEANARLGAGLGDILAGLVERTGCRRAAIAGGDTSSHAARRLGIFALTAMAATVPGAALCKAHRDHAEAGPLEVALKGGQMGTPDYFGQIRDGGAVNQGSTT